MSFSPLGDFCGRIAKHEKLCLLPAGRIDPSDVLDYSERCILYPRDSINMMSMRIVLYPEQELQRSLRRMAADPCNTLTLEGVAHSWFCSAATGITLSEFFNAPLLAFPVSIDWESFLWPDNHDVHLDMMQRAITTAEASLKRLGVNLQDHAAPDDPAGPLGRLPESFFDAALFYTPQDDESYIIGGRLPDR
jgi:hypothetical protein